MKVNTHNFLVAMAKKKYSVIGLSAESGVSRIVISQIKNDHGKNTTPAVVGAVAEALGVDMEYLIA